MITDEQKVLLMQQQNDRGILKKEIRSYEVSLWTLQDEFITVLKWSDVEQKGRIENPLLTINVDGTQKFTCSIPMYYRTYNNEDESLNGKLIENPNWYTVKTGQLIMGLRKLKIIFNKGSEYEINDETERAKIRSSNVFELLITKVTEVHEDDQLTCSIECEGLAFHELGKHGYKIDLNQELYLLDKTSWDEKGYWIRRDGSHDTNEPVENVNYWCEQCDLILKPNNDFEIRPNKWYYDIQMNWDSFNQTTVRDSKKVYEESYVSSWTNTLQPASVEDYQEKYRPVTVNESNIYNITQNIAETFGIYCKYVYGYDDNYNIISKTIVFYNNYFTEDDLVSFTYPYATKQITREMDATEVTTKMYVRPQDSDVIVSGEINIANCLANKTREDYLLNFDYLYTCGAITQEQYNEIPKFEVAVRNLNVELEEQSLQLNALEKTKIDNEALAKIYENSIALDQESIDYNTALYKRLDASDGIGDGYFSRVPAHPFSTYIHQDANGRYYIPLSTEDKGLQIDTLKIFRYYSSTALTFKNRITFSSENIVYDEYGDPKQITLPNDFSPTFTPNPVNTSYQLNLSSWQLTTVNDKVTVSNTSRDSLLVYLVYKYKPQLYYDKVNQIWITKLDEDTNNYQVADNAAKQAAEDWEILNEIYQENLLTKNDLIQSFNRMMGPALREGYWQPEEYKDYGDNKIEGADGSLNLTSTYNEYIMINSSYNSINKTYTTIGWDKELFDGENKIYYEYGVLKEKIYYPCIELNSTLLSQLRTWLSQGKKPSFIFNNNYYKTLTNSEKSLIQNLTIFALDSQMHLGFISNGSIIKPVLILTGIESMSEKEIAFMEDTGRGNPRLAYVETSVENNNARLVISNPINITTFVPSISNYFSVYPRIKISNNDLNTSTIAIKYNNTILENFEDYEILSRITTRFEKAYFEYFITIKPKVFFKTGSYTQNFIVNYTLSNAATCIYLDAIQVMLDSSKPRASYTVDVNILDINYLKTLYRALTQLVMINDSELKFENVFGYISQIELNLDAPWEDKIEVKNYKTKFEDLFTTIVASSEGMRQNAAAYDAAANGLIPLKEEALLKMISDNSKILSLYLDAGIDGSAHVKAMLSDIFTEAGAILASANSALNNVRSLTLRNASILSGFLENIAGELTPNVVNSRSQPTEFKVGDIWNELDAQGNVVARHVATSSSEDSASGYTRTYDGTLAAIKGASLEVDTVAGTIDILASNRIDMKSGGDIYIAANENVDIVGNKSVNIGGTQINIGSVEAIDPNSNIAPTFGGINLVAAKYDTIDGTITNQSLSKVLISPTNISMASASILMRTMDSALSIDPDNGIWIGSQAGIRLYSGDITFSENNDGTFEVNGSGANVELIPDHLLLGVSNTNSGTAIEMTEEYIVIGTGAAVNGAEAENKIALGITGLNTGLIGAKFTKDSIGFATNANGVINAILMNNKGITLGSGENGIDLTKATNQLTGSFVRIAAEGIDIGSTGHLRINTTNFKLDSSATGSTPMLGIYYNSGASKALEYTEQSGLYVHGNIINDQMAFINGTYRIGNSDKSSGLYLTNSSITQSPIYITYNGTRYYAWQRGGKTYYCTYNTGSSHTASSGETFLTYESSLKAVSPKYARKAIETEVKDGTNVLYTYVTYYITTDGKTLAKTSSNANIPYDGSTSPTASWYTSIPAANRASYANQYYSENTTLVSRTADNLDLVGKELTRSLDVTFSIEASSGLTTIKMGQIGNFYVSPAGLTGGELSGSNISNTVIRGCSIENENYSTGYYGRCFYDYSMNRNTGILILKRIDGTEEVIDIGTAAKVVAEGGSTTDSSNSSSGGTVSGCSGNCTGECLYTCTTSCAQDCTTACYNGCKNGCKGGCGDSCSVNCTGECYGGCGQDCWAACSSDCEGKCSGSCGEGCSTGCSGSCTVDCGSGCGTECQGGCSGDCGTGCTGYCQGSCGTSCTQGCANTCAVSCDQGCRGSSVPL